MVKKQLFFSFCEYEDILCFDELEKRKKKKVIVEHIHIQYTLTVEKVKARKLLYIMHGQK